MILQISSGQGPAECELAVGKFYEALCKEYPDIEMLSGHKSKHSGLYTSILFTTDADLSGLDGSVQWICRSPFRPNHGRKNWFIDGVDIILTGDKDFLEAGLENPLIYSPTMMFDYLHGDNCKKL